MRKIIGFASAIVMLLGIGASAHADPPKSSAKPAASSVAVAKPVVAKPAKPNTPDADKDDLVDPFKKRYDALVAGDYDAIQKSAGLINGVFGTYTEWDTFDWIVLAGMPNKKDWKPAAFMASTISDTESDMCRDLKYGEGGWNDTKSTECQERWGAYRKVTGPLLAYTYARENPTHLTTKDAEAALKAAYQALGGVKYQANVPDFKSWIQAKLGDKTKTDAKALVTSEYKAAEYYAAALDACRYDLDSTTLQKALDGLAAAGESEDEDARWTKWKTDAVAARKASKTCWDIGWRYLGPETECKDTYDSYSILSADRKCQTTGPVVLNLEHTQFMVPSSIQLPHSVQEELHVTHSSDKCSEAFELGVE